MNSCKSFNPSIDNNSKILILSMQLSVFAKNYEIYDIHQHYVPDCYKQALLSHGKKGAESDGLPAPVWSVEDQLKTMDDLGIKVTFISLATPHPYWGDKKFDPVFNELNKRKAIVVLHPVQFPNLPESTVKKYLSAVALYLQETTYAVLNLIYSGQLEKYPDIKFVIPHGGSFLTSVADRLEGFQVLAQSRTDYKLDDVKKQLNRFYYDLAGFPVPNQLFGLLNITDDSHLLYGSDYPYAFPNFIQSQKDKLDKTKLLTKKQKKKVYKDNFEVLFDLK